MGTAKVFAHDSSVAGCTFASKFLLVRTVSHSETFREMMMCFWN